MTIGDVPEGATSLDPDERDGLRYQHITTRGELDELEQANIQSGLLWLGRSRGRDVLTDEFLRILHQKLFGEVWNWAGRYRLTEKNIGVDPIQIATEVRNLVADARHWADHSTFVALEAAARFHHRLVEIHLFPKGNGRHGRIASDVYLQQYYSHPPIQWTHGFDLQVDNERRKQYIDALRSADAGDYDPILRFVSEN